MWSLVFCTTILSTILWYYRNRSILLLSILKEIDGTWRFAQVYLYYFWAKYWNLRVDNWFDNTANKYQEKTFIHFEKEEWTFRRAQLLTNQVANYFINCGFKKGDKIGLFMENRPEFTCIWLGLSKIGIVPALINTNLKLNSFAHCLKAGGCNSIIYGSELSEVVKEAHEQGLLNLKSYFVYQPDSDESVDENRNAISNAIDLSSALRRSSKLPPPANNNIKLNDELLYIYTSGTTGLPKAAIIKHSRYIMMCVATTKITGVQPNDIIYTPLPLYHASATVIGIGQGILFGSSVVLVKKFSASKFWKDCAQYRVTAFQYIGELCRFLLARPPSSDDTNHQIRLMFGNGFRGEIWNEFVNRFNIPNVCEFYASTEGNCALGNLDNKVGSVGRFPKLVSWFVSMYLIKVDKETGEPIRDKETGLCMKCGPEESGEMIGMIKMGDPIRDFSGYTDESSRKKKILNNVFKKGDSAFRTGDILVMDKDGYFYFRDRQGDTFRWKGENVSTAEVESTISKSVDLRDTAVYGVEIPGADGKAGMASIFDPDDTVDLTLLASKIKIELPSYARPLFIRKLKHLEMTGTHKIKKVEVQKDGYNITKIEDPIYFFMDGNYVKLDNVLYQKIIEGKIRV